jgi:hypothetical protein
LVFSKFRTLDVTETEHLSFVIQVGIKGFGVLANLFNLLTVGVKHLCPIVLSWVIKFVANNWIVNIVLKTDAF